MSKVEKDFYRTRAYVYLLNNWVEKNNMTQRSLTKFRGITDKLLDLELLIEMRKKDVSKPKLMFEEKLGPTTGRCTVPV